MLSISNLHYKIFHLNIIPAEKDLAEFFRLDHSGFPFPWSFNQWENLLTDFKNHMIITVRRDGLLIGFSLFKIDNHDKMAHLYKIIISNDYRKMGIGVQLLNESVRSLKHVNLESIYLEVQSDNLFAIKVYQKCGFLMIHRKKKFYSNGDNADIMQREL